MSSEPLTIFDICIKTTSAFEGADFGTISSNFDGQGASFGLLQFSLKSGSFQAYILNHINPFSYDYFPLPISNLINCRPETATTWYKDNCLNVDGKIKPEWREAFIRFLTTETVINLQKQACSKYFHRAKEICGYLGFKQDNKRAMCFAYDWAVQVWSYGLSEFMVSKDHAQNLLTIYENKNTNLWLSVELEKDQQALIIAAHLRSLKCKPEWRNAFFTRKATIAIGIGIVNGEKYDLRKALKES